jgi:beclin 1
VLKKCVQLLDLEAEEQSVRARMQYANETLGVLSRTNVFNLAFPIWERGPFGTINDLRLGRMPDQPVEWTEINAAWGQVVMLLCVSACMCTQAPH